MSKSEEKKTELTNEQQHNFDGEFFKFPLNIQYIHDLPAGVKKEGYDYRPVITTYPHDPFRVQNMLKLGWEFVYMEGNEIDERGLAPTDKPNVRKAPLIVTRTSGHKAVWMCIKSEIRQKRIEEQTKANQEKLLSSVKVKDRHNSRHITDEGFTT
jgi:hypothetical protein